MIEVLKQSAEDVSKVYDILAFGHTERALEILAKTRTSLRQAIAKLESQEPVACGTYQEVTDTMNALWAGTLEQVQIAEEMKNKKLYTAPPQRTWVGLTKEDKDLIEDLCEMMIGDAVFSTIDAILKGKNT